MTDEQFHKVASQLTGQVPGEVLREYLEYLDFGEPVVGFEYLCDFLFDEEVPLTTAQLQSIRELGASMNVTRDSFRRIDELRTDE